MEKNKKRYVIILLIVIVIMIGAYFWINRPVDDFFLDKEAKNGLIEARTKEDVQNVLDTIVEKGMFNASINPNPVFANGKAEGDLWIENIKANHYYTKVSITLEKNNELVFTSGGIKPDQNIEKAKLDKVLKKGVYPAIATFSIINPKDRKEIGIVNVKIKITIEK